MRRLRRLRRPRRPGAQAALLGGLLAAERTQQVAVRRVRQPRRVRRVRRVARRVAQVGVVHGHHDGAVLLRHGRHRVRVVRIGQMLLQSKGRGQGKLDYAEEVSGRGFRLYRT